MTMLDFLHTVIRQTEGFHEELWPGGQHPELVPWVRAVEMAALRGALLGLEHAGMPIDERRAFEKAMETYDRIR